MVIEPSLELVCSRAHEVVPMAPTPAEVEADDSDHETSDQVTTKPRRSTRTRTASEWCGSPVLKVMLLDNNEPTGYGEAMVGPDSNKWLEAIKSERGSMYENKVWPLEELLDARKAVGYRWILKGRRTMMVSITIKKARLVIKMFSDKFKELTTMRLSHS